MKRVQETFAVGKRQRQCVVIVPVGENPNTKKPFQHTLKRLYKFFKYLLLYNSLSSDSLIRFNLNGVDAKFLIF
jgi:hypothetical protein